MTLSAGEREVGVGHVTFSAGEREVGASQKLSGQPTSPISKFRSQGEYQSQKTRQAATSEEHHVRLTSGHCPAPCPSLFWEENSCLGGRACYMVSLL